jgi:hypothetical protein
MSRRTDTGGKRNGELRKRMLAEHASVRIHWRREGAPILHINFAGRNCRAACRDRPSNRNYLFAGFSSQSTFTITHRPFQRAN